MSESNQTIQIDSDRLKEIIEHTIMKDRASRPLHAPRMALYNCNVHIENNGDAYEEETGAIGTANTATNPSTQPVAEPETQRKVVALRGDLIKLMVSVEAALTTFESKPHAVLDAAGHTDNLKRQFAHLEHKRLGDTSLESVYTAYVNLIGALFLAAEAGGIFNG